MLSSTSSAQARIPPFRLIASKPVSRSFSTANALRDKVRAVTTDTDPPVTMVLIDMESVNYLDLEGSDMLKEIVENMKGAGVKIHLARVKHEVMEMLEKDEVDQIIGHDHIHRKVGEAASRFNQKTQTAVQKHK